MGTLNIEEKNIREAYEIGTLEQRKMLGSLFPELLTVKPSYPKICDRIKTFDDACSELTYAHPMVEEYMALTTNIAGLPDRFISYLKLRIICAALNRGALDIQDIKYAPKFELVKGGGKEIGPHGIRLDDYDTQPFTVLYPALTPTLAYSGIHFPVELSLRCEELAQYCGKQFIEIWADYLLPRKEEAEL